MGGWTCRRNPKWHEVQLSTTPAIIGFPGISYKWFPDHCPRRVSGRGAAGGSANYCPLHRIKSGGLFRLVANRLDVVTIRIEHERGVIVWMIVRTQAGSPVIPPARGKGRRVESIHARAA